jgi:glycosyltransferase involved in cell wall biosynthesis
VPGLRVAVDVTPLLGVQAGVARCVRNLLASVPAVAPEVDIVPFALSRRARSRLAELPEGTRALGLPAGVALRAWSRLDRPAPRALLDGVDVVHGTNFVVPPVDRPTTVTVHDTWCLRHPAECAPAVRPFDAVLRRAASRGTWLHVSTEATGREVSERYGTDRVVVVPFGVPAVADGGVLPGNVRAPFILALSTDEPRKRHAHLVDAFALVADAVDDVQLVLAGADAGATPAVESAIAALAPEVRHRVLRLGAVDDATRVGLLRGAAVLAYPSADEGFGFPALEAMAVGVPVVTTRAGGLPETTGDAAVLVDVVDEVEPLAGALVDTLTDAELRASLISRGRARVAALSWEAHAAGMAALWARAADAA